jgi:hypothetical protein
MERLLADEIKTVVELSLLRSSKLRSASHIQVGLTILHLFIRYLLGV